MKKLLIILWVMTGWNLDSSLFAQGYLKFDSECYMVDKALQTADNHYYVIGSSVNGTVVCRMNAALQTLWYKRIENRQFFSVLDIAETNQGNLAFMADWGDTSFLFKFSKTGSVLGARYFTSGTLNNFNPTSMTHSINGDGILLGGGFCNTDNYILRLDDNLNVVWNYKYNDGTATCAHSRSSDIVTESNRYVYMFNPSGGGVNLIAIDDNGQVLQTTHFPLNLQAAGFPIACIGLQEGGYVGNWESIIWQNGTEYIYIDSSWTKAYSRKYDLGGEYFLNDLLEYKPGHILIAGGLNKTGAALGDQSNLFFSVNPKGLLQWAKTSESVVQPQYGDVIHCITTANNQQMIAFGGGTDQMNAALLDANGQGYCNVANFSATLMVSDSVNGSLRTVNKYNSLHMVNGSFTYSIKDSSCQRNLMCGVWNNTPLSIETSTKTNKLSCYPVPARDALFIDGLDAEETHCKLFDLQGRCLLTQVGSPTGTKIRLDTKGLNPGRYMLQVNTQHEHHVMSILIEP